MNGRTDTDKADASRSRPPCDHCPSDALGSAPVFRFALINAADGDALGQVAFARADVKLGEVIPQGRARNLRVLYLVAPEREGEPPLLVVEVTELD